MRREYPCPKVKAATTVLLTTLQLWNYHNIGRVGDSLWRHSTYCDVIRGRDSRPLTILHTYTHVILDMYNAWAWNLCYVFAIIFLSYGATIRVCVEVSSNKGVEKDITWLLLWRLLCFLRQSLLLAFPFLGFQCRLERPKSSPPSSNTVLCFLQ